MALNQGKDQYQEGDHSSDASEEQIKTSDVSLQEMWDWENSPAYLQGEFFKETEIEREGLNLY